MTNCSTVQRLNDWSSLIAQRSNNTISPFKERQSETEQTAVVQLRESEESRLYEARGLISDLLKWVIRKGQNIEMMDVACKAVCTACVSSYSTLCGTAGAHCVAQLEHSVWHSWSTPCGTAEAHRVAQLEHSV
jgi:hypothetical protein